MIINLKREELQKIEKYLPDARVKDRGSGAYKIRGATEEQVYKVISNSNLRKIKLADIDRIRVAFPNVIIQEIDTDLDLYKIKGVEEIKLDKMLIEELETKKEPEIEIKKEITMSEPKTGFAGYMEQAARELENDMEVIKKNIEEKAGAIQKRMEEVAKRMEIESAEKVASLGKKVDEKLVKVDDLFKNFSDSIRKELAGQKELILTIVRQSKEVRNKIIDILKD